MNEHPLLGFVPQRRTPIKHPHNAMVWPLDPDRVCRRCWCSDCGQEWELTFHGVMVNGQILSVPKAWRPVLDEPDVFA